MNGTKSNGGPEHCKQVVASSKAARGVLLFLFGIVIAVDLVIHDCKQFFDFQYFHPRSCRGCDRESRSGPIIVVVRRSERYLIGEKTEAVRYLCGVFVFSWRQSAVRSEEQFCWGEKVVRVLRRKLKRSE